MKTDFTIEHPAFRDFYQVLDVSRGCSFVQLKKAYFRRVKECHPDSHPDRPQAEAEFRAVVSAFDVLSDPDKRRYYDEHLESAAAGRRTVKFVYRQIEGHSIMDSYADDILEELIVGNTIPEDTSLQNLLRDLENTENFIRFREGKTCLAEGKHRQALRILQAACKVSPENILYHYFSGRAAERLHKWSLADKQYRRCLRIGKHRYPPQRLVHIRQRLEQLRRKHRGVLGRIRNWFAGALPADNTPAEDRMIEETSRAMSKLLGPSKPKRKSKKKKPPPKQLQ